MGVIRNYPRTEDEYPEIMSKLDPLIIRVNTLVLVVGTTSYTAKVKMGIQFSGFTVHVSGVGLPIYEEKVDITGYSTNTTTTGEGSDAWEHIYKRAGEWMDDLEISILQNSDEKNIVDLLREIKFQMHFDLSGHKQDPSQYGPNFEYCTTQPTYLETLVKDVEILNGSIDGTTVQPNKSGINQKLDVLTGRIDSDNSSSYGDGLNQRVTDIRTQLDTMTGRLDSDNPNSYGDGLNQRITELSADLDSAASGSSEGGLNQRISKLNQDTQTSLEQLHEDLVGSDTTTIAAKLDDIATAVTNGYQTIADAIDNQTSRITTLITDLAAVATVVNNINTSVGTPPSGAQAEGYPSLQGYLRNIVSQNVKTLMSRLGQAGSSVGMYHLVEDIQSTVNTIHGTDVPAIENAISSSSSSGAVSDLSVVVQSIYNMVDGIETTVGNTNSTLNATVDPSTSVFNIDDINNLASWLCGDDAMIVLHDALVHDPTANAYIDAKILP